VNCNGVFDLKEGTAIRAIVTLAICGLWISGARADTASCENLAAALVKNSNTPYRSVSMISIVPANAGTGTDNQAVSETSETIFTGTEIFVRFGSGAWRKVGAPIDQLKKLVLRNAEGYTECNRLPDENRNGVPVAVYDGHAVTPQNVVEMRLWVATDRGLPIQSETEIVEASPTAANRQSRHIAIKYDYERVTPPPVGKP
jgi:hypothetical protein